MGSCILREASGYLPAAVAAAVYNGTGDGLNFTLGAENMTASQGSSLYSLATNCSLGEGGVCTRGLLHDFQASHMYHPKDDLKIIDPLF